MSAFKYEDGLSLGRDSDGEICVHTDDENLFLLGWKFERESGEPQRAEDYDGSLNAEQAEELRLYLNRAHARRSETHAEAEADRGDALNDERKMEFDR